MTSSISAIAAFVVALTACPVSAADLLPRTSDAYRTYVSTARRAFEQRVRHEPLTEPVRDGVIFAGPIQSDGIIGVPGGLVHHWVGSAFVPGVTLDRVLKVSTDYAHLTSVYKEVVASRVLGQNANSYHVWTRLKEHGAGLTAVLDITSTVEYRYPTPRSVLIASDADDIRQVVDAGSEAESLLPAGHDSGYLWGANDFTYVAETSRGVYIETETLGLSRPFPPALGWLIKPLARRLGRKSVETALQEFMTALTRR